MPPQCWIDPVFFSHSAMNYQWYAYEGLDANIGLAVSSYALAVHIASSGGQGGAVRNRNRSEAFYRLLAGLREQVPHSVVLAARISRRDTPLVRIEQELTGNGYTALEEAFRKGTSFRFDFWLKCSRAVETSALASALVLTPKENNAMVVAWPDDPVSDEDDDSNAHEFTRRLNELIAVVEDPSSKNSTKWRSLEDFIANTIDLEAGDVVAAYVSDMKHYHNRFKQRTDWTPVRILLADDDEVVAAMRAKFEDIANGKQRGTAETMAIVARSQQGWRLTDVYSNAVPTPEAASRLAKAAGLTLPKQLDDERALAESLCVPLEWLRDVLWLIEDKRAVVFYGPPGTGKTFIAQRIAEFIQPAVDLRALVQMHPSYGYEEFFEGFRPDVDGSGQMQLKKTDGPLKKLIKAATEKDDRAVLILDEMNRGNLPRVFGELYFLLEYRDKSTPLMYSPDETFSLPDTFTILGTMNTADRSVSLLDQALRRRFHFVPLFPGAVPVDGMLRRYLNSHYGSSMDWVAEMLAAANAKLDRNVAVGPSHFMRSDLDAGKVRRIWDHTVMPTIEEFYFGQETKLGEFSFENLRPRTDGDATSTSD
jgi:hypothetical protein